jgi:hypothetical protein
MRTPLLVAALFVGTVGCFASPVAVNSTNNPNIDVELLFEHDGCKVYRFNDHSYHYFARCDGPSAPPSSSAPQRPTASTSDTRSCGKNCAFEETIVTSEP